jgi:glycine oxidase
LRALFVQDTYIVLKANGRIIVGATVKPGQYDGNVTPEGMMHCLSEAVRLVPSLARLPIEKRAGLASA